MALNNITKFEWDSDRRFYILETDNLGVYAVRTNAKIRYLGWLSDKDSRWIILDRNDVPFNEEDCWIRVEVIRGRPETAESIKKALEAEVLTEQ